MEGHVVLAPEVIGHIGVLPVTNTLMVSWVTMVILITLAFVATRKIALVPSGVQNLFEAIIEGAYKTVEDLAGSRARIFFPF